MAQWVNISECARLYGRSRKWVDNRIKKHNMGTEKSVDGNEKRFNWSISSHSVENQTTTAQPQALRRTTDQNRVAQSKTAHWHRIAHLPPAIAP